MEGRRMVEGNLVDVVRGEIRAVRVEERDGVVTRVTPASGTYDGFLVPGFIDAHVHVESSLLCPSRFAEAVVPRGTTAVVTDPHEIANVMGMPGMDYMAADARATPLRVRFTAPSCVPATPFETSGAVLGPEEVDRLLAREEFVALGEVMNYPGAIRRDPDVMAKIGSARRHGKPVDGHCPGLSGRSLEEYAGLGISTDHECTSAEEALEKARAGMTVMVREGSVAKNLDALLPFAMENDFLLVTDDILVTDLLEGHLDRILSRMVRAGMDPIHALRSVTLRPALHYGLPLGAVEPGRMADVVKVSDLESFAVEEVYIHGRIAAHRGAPMFSAWPVLPAKPALPFRKETADFEIPSTGERVEARVIVHIPGSIETGEATAVLPASGGRVLPDPSQDVLSLAVVNRYRDAPVANAFVRGFGLRRGAIASSVAHDSHNILVLGANATDMAAAANALLLQGGGFCVCEGRKSEILDLRIGGLMSADPAAAVADRLGAMHRRARELGCTAERPFMALSFMSLLVVPRLKIGDRGLFDVDRFEFVEVLPRRAA